jgi:glutathione S-transferase
MLTHGDQTIFESGAALLYVGELSDNLLPKDQAGRFNVTQWVFGALNSMEMASLPWSLFKFTGTDNDESGFGMFNDFLTGRLTNLERFIGDKDWLTGPFSIADIAMVDALRLIDRFDELAAYPACRALKERGEARPAFIKAHADQLAHFKKRDG